MGVVVPVDLELFKRIAGSFPAGVAVVTAVGEDGVPRGLTSNAICSVSADPPMLLVCVDKGSQTLPAIQWAGAFTVNFLADGRQGLADRFASKDPDKFAGVAWKPSTVAGGAPLLIQDVVATAECLVDQAVEAGDHWVLLGGIESGSASDGLPLMYFRRHYAGWPGPRPAGLGAISHDDGIEWDFH